jgi:hypothetical protein
MDFEGNITGLKAIKKKIPRELSIANSKRQEKSHAAFQKENGIKQLSSLKKGKVVSIYDAPLFHELPQRYLHTSISPLRRVG